jgi:hypothetical protein
MLDKHISGSGALHLHGVLWEEKWKVLGTWAEINLVSIPESIGWRFIKICR